MGERKGLLGRIKEWKDKPSYSDLERRTERLEKLRDDLIEHIEEQEKNRQEIKELFKAAEKRYTRDEEVIENLEHALGTKEKEKEEMTKQKDGTKLKHLREEISLYALLFGYKNELKERDKQVSELEKINNYLENKYGSFKSREDNISSKSYILENSALELVDTLFSAYKTKNVIFLDGDNKIRAVTDNARKILGYDECSGIMKKDYEEVVYDEINQKLFDAYLLIARSGGDVTDKTFQFKRANGKPIKLTVDIDAQKYKELLTVVSFRTKGFLSFEKEEVMVKYDKNPQKLQEEVQRLRKKLKRYNDKDLFIDLNYASSVGKNVLGDISGIAKEKKKELYVLNPSNRDYKYLLKRGVKESQIIKL
ncbi:hypothetical protein GF336_00765 [Candidatus Woesearchaeota archaeon]|nr:hypothetical protein [Candidatus Woesearchaeota archaeon]